MPSLPPSERNLSWPPPSLQPVEMRSNLERWESFDWGRHPDLLKAKPVIVDWYNGLPDSGVLILAGDVGCGKTHIANAIADLFGRWRLSMYEEIELVKKIQATYNGNGSESEESIFKGLFRSELLILDDLGTYHTDSLDWLQNLYIRIFGEFMTVKSRPVLITTNLPMYGDDDGESSPLKDRIGTRAHSRLYEALRGASKGQYVDLFGIADYRSEDFLKG